MKTDNFYISIQYVQYTITSLWCFQEYKNTLDLACEKGRAFEYGYVNWTVSADTPDLVYYQSFYHFGMGWKIHVLDEGEEPSSVNSLYQFKQLVITYLGILIIAVLLPHH